MRCLEIRINHVLLQTPRVIRVSLGDHSWMDKKYKFVTVSKIVVHPDFVITPDYMGWDYAVLTLTKPVQFSHKVQSICLPASGLKDYSGLQATITGWGLQNYTDYGRPPKRLRVTNVTIISNTECQGAWDKWETGFNVTEENICTWDQGTRGACRGDSGGPLFVKENTRCCINAQH